MSRMNGTNGLNLLDLLKLLHTDSVEQWDALNKNPDRTEEDEDACSNHPLEYLIEWLEDEVANEEFNRDRLRETARRHGGAFGGSVLIAWRHAIPWRI